MLDRGHVTVITLRAFWALSSVMVVPHGFDPKIKLLWLLSLRSHRRGLRLLPGTARWDPIEALRHK